MCIRDRLNIAVDEIYSNLAYYSGAQRAVIMLSLIHIYVIQIDDITLMRLDKKRRGKFAGQAAQRQAAFQLFSGNQIKRNGMSLYFQIENI